ncbi:MAG: FHA domain-containing protein [Acidobacteriota bacterium]
MRARLYSPASALVVDHEFKDEVTLGRAPSNTLCLDSRLLSGQHARIRWDGELACYRLEDLGSTNGTRLDGRQVEDALLGHLHVVTLADKLDIVFQDLDRCAARHRAQVETSAAAPLPPAPQPAAAIPEVERTQHTSIQSLAIALPELLRAPGAQTVGPAAGDSSSGVGIARDGTPSEGTLLERLPLPLPDFLRQSGESAAAPAPSPPAPPPKPASSVIPSAGRITSDVPPTQPVSKNDPAVAAALESKGPPAGAVDVFFLAAHSQAGTQHYEIREGVNLIGRAATAEIRIDSPEVSRQHAQITLRDGRMMLRDLGSRNRTFVNGEPLGKEAVAVMPGQRLRFGALEVALGVSAARPGGGIP